MPHPKVKIADNSGNTVGVTDNKLDVNLGYTPSIDIGDVEILGHATIAEGTNTDVGTSAEVLSTSQACKHVDVMAAIANTGIIWVGGSSLAANRGIALYAGDVYSIDIDNVNNIYVLASVNGEDVHWVYYN